VGGTSRPQNCPIFSVTAEGTTQRRDNIYINYLDITGDYTAGTNIYHLVAPAISIVNSIGVTVDQIRVKGARDFGVLAEYSSLITVVNSSFTMSLGVNGEPDGGAPIWLVQCANSLVQGVYTNALEYYNTGTSLGDYQAGTDAVLPMTGISSYGGSNDVFEFNEFAYTNSGVQIASCAASGICHIPSGVTMVRNVGAVIRGNVIHHHRQLSLDMANADNVTVANNEIYFGDYALIGMGDVQHSLVESNYLHEGGLQPTSVSAVGAVYLLWGSSYNTIQNNTLYGYGELDSVYILGPVGGSGYPNNPISNIVTNNDLWKGTSGYFGGVSTNDTLTPNTLH